jgi:hypothetical protein
MRILSTAALTLALMTGASALALAATDPASTQAAPAKPAVSTPAAKTTTTTSPVIHKTTMHHVRRDVTGDRDTAALNLLESHGYGQIVQFHQDGQAYDATVHQNGKDLQLTVNPSTGQIQKRA